MIEISAVSYCAQSPGLGPLNPLKFARRRGESLQDGQVTQVGDLGPGLYANRSIGPIRCISRIIHSLLCHPTNSVLTEDWKRSELRHRPLQLCQWRLRPVCALHRAGPCGTAELVARASRERMSLSTLLVNWKSTCSAYTLASLLDQHFTQIQRSGSKIQNRNQIESRSRSRYYS